MEKHMITILGCVDHQTRQCQKLASAGETSTADKLVKTNLRDRDGTEQANGFEATYEMIGATSCNGLVILDYAPKTLQSSNMVIVGSRVRYTVDLKSQTVDEDYLE
jgi:hypothetical protein